MKNLRPSQIAIILLIISSLILSSCVSSAKSRYWGKTIAPSDNIMRYISGSEIESLDPHISSGQPEARVYLALFEGLVEYHPKTMQPVPALAERWETGPNVDEFIFHLRKNGRWSNGDPITAKDFVFSIRRGLTPELLSRNAYQSFKIKYAEEYNSGSAFVKKNGEFLLKKDFAAPEKNDPPTAEKPAEKPIEKPAEKPVEKTAEKPVENKPFGPETEFGKFINAPERLTVSSDEKERAKQFEANPRLKEAFEGAELVPVKAEDVGVEAIDDYTLRIKLKIPAPFFVGLLAHQFFRLVPQKAIEKYGKDWVTKEYVTNGPFKLKQHAPYDKLVVEKDPMYWDVANVKLDGIEFYPSEEQTTMQNLYKAGAVDATYNRTVPVSWLDEIKGVYVDEYMNHPDVSIEYYTFNVNKPPVNDINVRKAFSAAINREALSKFRKIASPLYDFTPGGIFPEFEEAKKRVGEEIRKERKMSPEEWANRNKFDAKKACDFMEAAKYKVNRNSDGTCKVEGFPADKTSITYNTAESNKAVAEFIQAQWKLNLGIEVPLKNMEWKTFLEFRNKLQYDTFARAGWVGDYMDPYTFLSLHYGKKNEGATGWYDPKYDQMLDNANRELDLNKRNELLAKAEFYLMDNQVVVPLTNSSTNWIKKPYIKGMFPNPGTLHAWKFVYVERDPAKWDKNVDGIISDKSDPTFEKQIADLKSTMTK